ncbi:MAG TPA: hypothetical protein VIN10_14305 [Bacteroidales bacterium]
MKSLIAVPVLGLALFLSSCDKVPQVELDNANVAINEAKMAEADVYLPTQFAALEDSMRVVMADIEVQNSKWMKNFDGVRTKLSNLTSMATTVKANTEAKIEEIKNEYQTAFAEVQQMIVDNKALVEKAPKGKGGREALEQIKGDISVVEISAAEAQSLFDAGKYMDALNKINAAKTKSVELNTELVEAIAKTTKR